jgi:glutamyl aminopeptidase
LGPPVNVTLRLKETLFPISYDLFLYPHLVERIFTGNVKILLNITEATDEIILHSNNLTINDVKYSAATVSVGVIKSK